jgi:hypothetical protein
MLLRTPFEGLLSMINSLSGNFPALSDENIAKLDFMNTPSSVLFYFRIFRLTAFIQCIPAVLQKKT